MKKVKIGEVKTCTWKRGGGGGDQPDSFAENKKKREREAQTYIEIQRWTGTVLPFKLKLSKLKMGNKYPLTMAELPRRLWVVKPASDAPYPHPHHVPYHHTERTLEQSYLMQMVEGPGRGYQWIKGDYDGLGRVPQLSKQPPLSWWSRADALDVLGKPRA